MQGWVGRGTLCIGEKFHPPLLYFVPTLICNFSHTLSPGVRIDCERKKCRDMRSRLSIWMRCNNPWCNVGNQIRFPLEITLVRQWEENRVLPQLSIVHFRLHYFKFEGFCLSLRWCMLFFPPCVGCEHVCERCMFIWIICMFVCVFTYECANC